MKNFSRFARDRIRALSKNQKDLAEELGVSPAYISQILTGKKNPPDLGKPRNRLQLKAWSQGLGASEDDILDMVRYELHRVPPRPEPRYRGMRELLLRTLDPELKGLSDEMRALELHPAESLVIQALVQIYVVLHQPGEEVRGYGPVRFRDFCRRAAADRGIVDNEVSGFFGDRSFSWHWDAASNEVRIVSDSSEIREGLFKARKILSDTFSARPTTVPIVGHVSAGAGFEYTDGGYYAGEGFEQVPLPPGVEPELGAILYCVRVRGDSLKEFFGDGAMLFIKPESWEEVKDGDLVIFKDRNGGRAFVKKVEFVGDSLILKSMNPMYKNMVLQRADLMLLERVMAIVL